MKKKEKGSEQLAERIQQNSQKNVDEITSNTLKAQDIQKNVDSDKRVFISYAHEDHEAALRIYSDLKEI
jgi:hypothetical protein